MRIEEANAGITRRECLDLLAYLDAAGTRVSTIWREGVPHVTIAGCEGRTNRAECWAAAKGIPMHEFHAFLNRHALSCDCVITDFDIGLLDSEN